MSLFKPGKVFFTGLAIGVASGVLLHRYWPVISRSLEPYVGAISAKTRGLFESGREAFSGKPERFSDVIEEIKKDDSRKKT